MKTSIFILFFISTSCFALDCKFKDGNAIIDYHSENLASVSVNNPEAGATYHNCKVSSDEFGKLIDCSTGNRDFMLVISKENAQKKGGIMSKTLNLFDDITC